MMFDIIFYRIGSVRVSKKNKIIKIILLILLVVIIGGELFFLVFTGKDDKKVDNLGTNVVTDEIISDEEKVDNTKYLTDITTSFNKNPLKLNRVIVEENANYSDSYYYTISGLKDTVLEDKINSVIKEKYNNLIRRHEDYKYVISSVSANFENVLSVTFSLCYQYDKYTETCLYDTYNVDLSTGKEIKLEDVFLDTSFISTELTNDAIVSGYLSIGIVCYGGACNNPNPDYSTVEDEAFKIASKYRNGDYKFSISSSSVEFYFEDVYRLSPDQPEYGEKVEGYACHNLFESDEPDYEPEIYCDFIDRDYIGSISFFDHIDDMIIYEKFKTKENIFKDEMITISRKFIQEELKPEDINYTEMFYETEGRLVDYMFDDRYAYDTPKNFNINLNKEVLKESSGLVKKDKKNFSLISGRAEMLGENYYYAFYNVYHYTFTEKEYEDAKKYIYLNNINGKRSEYEDGYVYYPDGYEEIKKYLSKEAYYFYIYDLKGKPVSCKEITSKEALLELESLIPDSWLKLGKYKTKTDLINSLYYMIDDSYEFPDRLIIVASYGNVTLKYKGKEVRVDDLNFYDRLFK